MALLDVAQALLLIASLVLLEFVEEVGVYERIGVAVECSG